jgi:superfamily I DNA and RNA helicase
VQHFDDPTLWEEIGYQVVKGQLSPGSTVTLARRPESYPDYFLELLDRNDAVVHKIFYAYPVVSAHHHM